MGVARRTAPILVCAHDEDECEDEHDIALGNGPHFQKFEVIVEAMEGWYSEDDRKPGHRQQVKHDQPTTLVS